MNASANTIQSQVRSMFEFGHVLKRFLKIKTTQEFLKIFPEQKKYNDIIDDSLIPFYVARLALEVEHVFHQKFGLDTLFDLFTNKTLVQKMEKICHFNYTDFIKYTGIHDIYHVQHIDFQNKKIKTLTQEIERLKSIQSLIRSLFKKCNLALKMK